MQQKNALFFKVEIFKKSFNMKLLIISIYDYTCNYKLLKLKQVQVPI